MFWRQVAISDHKNHEYIKCRQYVSDFIRTVIRKWGWFLVASRVLSIFVFLLPNDRVIEFTKPTTDLTHRRNVIRFSYRTDKVHHGCFSSSECCAENWIISFITEPYAWSFERHINVVVIKRANSKVTHLYINRRHCKNTLGDGNANFSFISVLYGK